MTDTVWIHYARPRPHWYELDEAARAAHLESWATVAAASQAEGGEQVGRFHVRGQHDFETVEIWRFPDAEAAFDHWARLGASAYNEWFAFSNNVGLRMGAEG